jgi:diguanylate cyclase (GGDEF)-like protein
LLFVDLDHFKQVNDTLGHAAGDELLVICSARLAGCLPAGDLVGRLGGDEFAILLADTTPDAAHAVAGRVLKVLSEPTVIAGHELVMTASIGLAFSSPGADAHDLLRNADLAMYVAKSSGRARYDVYDDAMHERAVERLELQADLRHAITDGGITIECQPIVDISSGVVRGAEVLARWTHPRRGRIGPDVFIPLAERSGAIHALGTHVFTRACDFAQRLARVDPTLTVTVNLSPLQLTDDRLPETFAAILRARSIDPSRIVIEVTENVLMQDLDVATDRLAQLKKIGVRIAVDDFGVGHSSLSYLRNLPLDVLKIDKSFIDDLPRGADVTRVMIQLGRLLGLDVVAEGVVTPHQRTELEALGCLRAQGYLFARPMNPAALLEQLLEGDLPVPARASDDATPSTRVPTP